MSRRHLSERVEARFSILANSLAFSKYEESGTRSRSDVAQSAKETRASRIYPNHCDFLTN